MNPEWLSQFTKRRRLYSTYSWLLLLALCMLADGWLLIRIARELGAYLTLAIEAATAILAAIIVGSSIHSAILRIERSARDEGINWQQFRRLFASVAAAALLTLPGFATDALGLFIYMPPGRLLFGHIVTRIWRSQVMQAYEYVKLSALDDS